MIEAKPNGCAVETTYWWDITGVDPIVNIAGRRFRPTTAVVTFRTYRGEVEGFDEPSWRARLVGPLVRKDGTESETLEVDERYWQSHHDVPGWLRDLVKTAH